MFELVIYLFSAWFPYIIFFHSTIKKHSERKMTHKISGFLLKKQPFLHKIPKTCIKQVWYGTKKT